MEWDGHLVIFSCPRVMENSRQYLVLRTDILRKTVVGCRDNISVIFADTAFKLKKLARFFQSFIIRPFLSSIATDDKKQVQCLNITGLKVSD